MRSVKTKTMHRFGKGATFTAQRQSSRGAGTMFATRTTGGERDVTEIIRLDRDAEQLSKALDQKVVDDIHAGLVWIARPNSASPVGAFLIA
jgi:hypothetical protein